MAKYQIQTDKGTYLIETQDAPAPAAPVESPSVSGFLHNAVSSAGSFLGGVANAVTHPLDTANNLGNLVGGLGNEYVPGAEANKRRGGATDSEIAQQNAIADAFKKQLTERYGSTHGFANAVYTDPVGVLADLSTIAGGISGIAGKTAEVADMANAASLASKAGQVAKVAGKVANLADPLNAVTKPAGALARATGLDQALPALARGAYQSALKPSRANSLEDIDKMVQTGLDQQIPVSREGIGKLNQLIQEWKSQLNAKVQAETQAGATVDPQAVAKRVDQIAPTFKNQVNPVKDAKAIDAAKQEFLAQQTAPIPLDLAQALKENSGKLLSDKYGELGTASIEAQKALVRGIKEEIETQFPEIGALNAQLSPALDLEPAIEAALKRGGNKDLMDLATKMGHPGMGALSKVLGSAEFKSRLAFALQKAYQANPTLAAIGVPSYKVLANRVNQYANALAQASAVAP